MHNILIKNFGPLKDIELHPDKLTFLLGEQASGKSTIVKLLYFFRTCKDEFVNLGFTNDSHDWFYIRGSYTSILLTKFFSMFGDLKVLGNFHLKYTYTVSGYITITSYVEEGKLTFELSPDLDKKLEIIWNDLRSELAITKENAFDMQQYILSHNIYTKIMSSLDNIFDDNAYEIYIPAGRAFLTHQVLWQLIQADEIKRMTRADLSQYDIIDSNTRKYDVIDAPTRNFLYEVSRVREQYFAGLLNRNIDDSNIESLKKLMYSILKGTYVTDKLNDFIQLSGNQNINISYASSGQQEVMWLLNLLYAYAVEKRKCFIIIEEPETHLYPEAQYMLVKFIAVFCNYTASHMVVATHSPYILSSFNNLIFAGKCGKSSSSDKLKEIIPTESWLDPNDFSSYMLEKGEIRNIKDDDLAMIDIAELDAVASGQDTEYEKMLSIYSEVG